LIKEKFENISRIKISIKIKDHRLEFSNFNRELLKANWVTLKKKEKEDNMTCAAQYR